MVRILRYLRGKHQENYEPAPHFAQPRMFNTSYGQLFATKRLVALALVTNE